MRNSAPVLLSIAAAFASACSGPAQSAAPEKVRALPVRTAAVEKRDLVDSVVMTGTLKPRAQVQVVAEVGARLLKVLRDEGASVGDGELLARLDETDYRLAHDRARAALAVAEANRAHALAERERAENLVKTGGITDKENLAAQVALQVAEAALAQARAETAISAQQLARCEIKAPFAGRVAKRMADAGSQLAAGTPLFTLVDDSVLEFRAAVPSNQWSRVRVGATVTVTVDSLPGFETTGRVARIAPLVEERTRTFEAVVEVPGRKELVGGLFARASVASGRRPGALVVPPAALQRDAATGKATLYVVAGDKAQRREVALGIEDAAAVQVADGVEVGEQVVLDPPVALGDGTPVEVQKR